MKEIFIGSSTEGLEQATQVAAVLSEAQDVKPLLWTADSASDWKVILPRGTDSSPNGEGLVSSMC